MFAQDVAWVKDLVAIGGVSLLVLVFFSVAVWRVLQWVGREIVKPLSAAGVALLTKLQEEVPQHTELLKQTKETLAEQTVLLQQIVKSIDRGSDASADAAEVLKKQNDMIDAHHTWAEKALVETKLAIDSLPCRSPTEVSARTPIQAKKTDYEMKANKGEYS